MFAAIPPTAPDSAAIPDVSFPVDFAPLEIPSPSSSPSFFPIPETLTPERALWSLPSKPSMLGKIVR